MNLAGMWKLGFSQGKYTKEICFPTVVQQHGIGTPNRNPEDRRWGRAYLFEGEIWMQRDITVTAMQVAQTALLTLERCHWRVSVYLNDRYVAQSDTISTAQQFDLSGFLQEGVNRLTLCVDNSMIYPLRNGSHHFSADTQGNWNGILGQMTLDFYPSAYLKQVQVDGDVMQKMVHIRTKIINNRPDTADYRHEMIRFSLSSGEVYQECPVLFCGENEINFHLEMDEIRCWSHVDPHLYQLTLSFLGQTQTLSFGFRQIEARGKHLYVNGNRVHLRGSHDACVFPKTGAPPMTVDGWLAVFSQYRTMGLNHFRAHSWCPPKAAFEAADRMGIYLQVEGPASGALGQGQSVQGECDPLQQSRKTQAYIEQELRAIQDSYGSHPSFVMLSIGNELYTDYSILAGMVDRLKANDTRHLICGGSNNNWSSPHIGHNDDFFVGFMIDRWHGLLRGSYHTPDVGHINNQAPNTCTDYESACQSVDVPIITHELGQYLAYPDYREIDCYDGQMRPYHLESFKQSLAKNGMYGMDQAFHLASGRLQQELYKEEIEANLRTESMSGYQLLDIKDFPGQGVALCGVLDVFGKPKAYFDLAQWQDVCCDVVPLLLLPKRVFSVSESATAGIKVANYGDQDQSGDVVYQLSCGNTMVECMILHENVCAKKGGLQDFGTFVLEFDRSLPTGQYSITIRHGNRKNKWNIWLFQSLNLQIPSAVWVTHRWDLALEKHLLAGGDAVYLGNADNLKHTIKGAFQNNFWSYRMFEAHQPAGTVGMLVDTDHPIFAHYPTANHSDWQWYHMTRYASPLQMRYLPDEVKPIAQPIDTYERNLKLGLLFEVQVGKGRLFVSTFDFEAHLDQIEVKTLYRAILDYMQSPVKVPAPSINPRALDCIFQVQTDNLL